MSYTKGAGKTGRVNAPYGSTPWEKVIHYGWDVVSVIPELGPCWVSKAPRGGRLYRSAGAISAHRASYEHHVGPVPEGMLIRHRCDNHDCVNPEHLEPGTHADNMRDMRERHRSTFGERNPSAKLTEPEIFAIRSRVAAEGVKPLAREYGVSPAQIRKIRDGKSWAYLE